MPKGGARPGSGRPKGGKNADTILKLKAEKKLLGRRLAVAARILNAQINLAEGCSFVYEIITDGKKKEHKLVTDPARIESFLNDGPPDDETYMYITTERPDGRAIADFFDRTFGKPQQAVEVTGANGEPLIPLDVEKMTPEQLDQAEELALSLGYAAVESDPEEASDSGEGVN